MIAKITEAPVTLTLSLKEARVLRYVASRNVTVANAVDVSTVYPYEQLNKKEEIISVLDDLFYALQRAGVLK